MSPKQYPNPEQLVKERKKLVTDIVRCADNPVRIPVAAQTRAWPIFDAGYKLTEALSNYELLEQIMCRFHETYEFDLYVDLCTRFSYRVALALGGGGFVIDDERQAIYYNEAVMVKPEEYDDLIKYGLLKEYYEKVFPRKYTFYSKEDAIQKIIKGARENYELRKFNDRVINIYEKYYGVPRGTNDSPITGKTPTDEMLAACGIRGFSAALRRLEPAYMFDVLNAFDNGSSENTLKMLDSYAEKDNETFTFSLTSISATFLNAKQFESYALPYWKRYIDKVIANNQIGCLFIEGTFNHLIEYFQDIPAGHFMMFTEMDDLKGLMNKLPNMTFCGGYPTFYLGHNTKQECIDKAKEVVDDLGRDKRLVFATDKMMAFPSDAKGENFLAITQFVKEYGKF